jgi:hypothetical protein
VAIFSDGVLSVYDLEADALLGSVLLPLSNNSIAPQLFFADRDTVRLYVQEIAAKQHTEEIVSASLRVVEFRIGDRSLAQTGEMKTTARWLSLQVSVDGSTMLVRRFGAAENGVLLADARTGQPLATLPVADPGPAVFFGTEGVAALSRADGMLRLYDRSGRPLRDIEVASSGGAIDIGRNDKIVVSVRDAGPYRTLLTVDTASGVIERREPGLVYLRGSATADPRQPEASGELVVSDRRGALWRWNALTGEKRTLPIDRS